MEMLTGFLFALLSGLALTVVVHAQQDQSGFISIDCGIPENSSYTDETTGINYSSDATFIDTGISTSVSPEFKTSSLQQQLWNVRNFPQGTKNCYTLRPARGKDNKYLIRATFMYGNYDARGQVPEFDLHLGVNKWDSVKLNNTSTIITKEIIHVPSSNYVYICLVNTGFGTPFVSALELRPLNNSMYTTQSGSLVLSARLDIGSETNQVVRYKDDVYDRIWLPYNGLNLAQLSTLLTIDSQSHNILQPPSIVMRTAVTPLNASDSLDFYWEPDDPTSQFYVYMHFAELEELQLNQSRAFNISLNGDHWYGPVVPDYLYTTTIYSPSSLSEKKFDFSIYKTENSTLPPIINAIEVYIVKQLLQSQTDQKDVDTIMNIKSMYGVKRNWQGDPCAPKAYLWEGLNCSYNGYDPPRIISLNLSSSGLTGEIPPYISNLTLIQYLDLSNNSLTGPVPDFLSQLQFLSVLNLTGNKFNGSVPLDLVERSKNGSLLLSVGKNPSLCPSVSCKKKKNKLVLPVVASVAASSILLTALLAILWCLKRRKRVGKVESESNKKDGLLGSKNRQFTYSEVLSITNNFQRVVGKGGFGTVYHGYLDDTEVAVKMLSPSSIQGYEQFQTEVKLLMRVHHRNLTTLVGYCNEDTNTGLIYEYMANGNLEGHLSDRTARALSWEERLQIATDAAQALEYLHNGCKPPIIHRDVKSTNILLNENFQAKLADFGLSRVFPNEGRTHVSTVVVGTPGYLDPEYYVSNRLNEKSDVYSFGIVLLEIITSRPVIEKSHDKTHIIQWVSFLLAKGDIKSIVDPRLRGDFDINSVWKAVETAMSCVSLTSIKRPTMSQVGMELKECLATEIARTKEGHETESKDSIELVPMNLDTGLNPTSQVVMELKECLATEIAQTKESHETESKDSIELVPVNLDTGLSPLSR